MSKFLSVIIPTYKRSDNLERAINSIINQTSNDFEIIVVDDNDSDSIYRKETEKVMSKYLKYDFIKYLKHIKNMNGATARNTGIKEAEGKFITFLDDDDEFTSDRIKSIKDEYEKEKFDFAVSGVVTKENGQVQKRNMPKIKKIRELQYDLLCLDSFFGTGSNIICKKEIVDSVNGFDVNFIRHQDFEFVIRCLDISKKLRVIPNYSVIKNNDDYLNVPSFEKMIKVKKMYLDKFSEKIKLYTKEMQNRIYHVNYYELLYNAYLKNDRVEIKKAIQLLKEYKIYNPFKRLLYFFKINVKKMKIVKSVRSKVFNK